MAEIIRPPEFNRPSLQSLLEKAESIFIELNFTQPDIYNVSSINRFALDDVNKARLAELLEHHLIQFKSAVQTQPEKLQEIISGSAMLWLCMERAKKLVEQES